MEELIEVIHAIDLCEFYPCHNIGIDGRLISPGWLAKIAPKGVGAAQKSIGDIPIPELCNGRSGAGMVTPRFAHTVIEASALRQGKKLKNGRGEEILYSDETIRERVFQSDVELAFEEYRRRQFPREISRLSCIYLAERSSAGKALIREMLGPTVEVLDVRITGLIDISRCDVSWFDEYCKTPDEQIVEKYWSGDAHSNRPKWEYLLDGQIELEDLSLLNVLEKGTFIP